jgi:hypothetical protein
VFRLLEFFRGLFRSSSVGSSSNNTRPDSPAAAAPTSGVSPRDAALPGESVASPSPIPVTSSERLSRYVFDQKYVNSERVHFRAFEPPTLDVAISVSRTEGFSEERVWAHGDEWTVGTSARQIVGRGDFTPALLANVRAGDYLLAALPDEPPPHHANIVGWPSPAEKEVRRSLAQQLAARAKPIVRF